MDESIADKLKRLGLAYSEHYQSLLDRGAKKEDVLGFSLCSVVLLNISELWNETATVEDIIARMKNP